MGGREKIENAQRKKCLETDISTTCKLSMLLKIKTVIHGFWIHSNYHSHLRAKRFDKDSGSISLLWNIYSKKHSNQLRLESNYFKDEKSKTNNSMNNYDVLRDGCNITSLPTNSSNVALQLFLGDEVESVSSQSCIWVRPVIIAANRNYKLDIMLAPHKALN